MKRILLCLLFLVSACGSKIVYENRVQRHRAVASGKAFKTIKPIPTTHESYQPEKKCIKTEASDPCSTQD